MPVPTPATPTDATAAAAAVPFVPFVPFDAPRSRNRRPAPAWLREPLLHFALLGALLFGVDHLFVARADDPRTIVVGAEVDKESREVFKAARGRDPNAEELTALRRIWLDNEILYREGMALRVDQGDTAIRDRVIFKALNVVEANLKLPPVDDRTLNNWFAARRAKYDEPVRLDFDEAVLSGENTEAAVRAFVAELNASPTGDAKAGLRVFKGRPHDNVVQSYGAELAKTLESMPPGEWQALATRDGWRAMRVTAVTPGRPAVFEVMRNVVLQDWTDAVMAEQRTAAVRALGQKYRIRGESAAR